MPNHRFESTPWAVAWIWSLMIIWKIWEMIKEQRSEIRRGSRLPAKANNNQK